MLVSMVLSLMVCGDAGCDMQIVDDWYQVDQITAAAECLEEKKNIFVDNEKAACYIQTIQPNGDILLKNIENGAYLQVRKGGK